MLASATYFTAKALIGPVAGRDASPAGRVRPGPADDHHTAARTRSGPSTWRRICAAVLPGRTGVPGRAGRGRRELSHTVQTD
jgi:hypothetical protein